MVTQLIVICADLTLHLCDQELENIFGYLTGLDCVDWNLGEHKEIFIYLIDCFHFLFSSK